MPPAGRVDWLSLPRGFFRNRTVLSISSVEHCGWDRNPKGATDGERLSRGFRLLLKLLREARGKDPELNLVAHIINMR